MNTSHVSFSFDLQSERIDFDRSEKALQIAKENDRPQNFAGLNPQQMREEKDKALAILAQLEDEQSRIDSMLIERQDRAEALKNEIQEIKSSASASTTKPVSIASVSSDSLRALQSKILDKDAEIKNYTALLDGVQRFSGMKLIEVKAVSNGGLTIQMKIAKVEAMFCLDSSMKLCDIKILAAAGDSSVNVAAVMRAAKVFTPPNDIRQAIFSLGAQQNAMESFKNDLSELKKRILVRQLSDLKAQLTLSNGVIVDLEADVCYPEVPQGVSITSAIGIGGWSSEELEIIKSEVNATQCRTVQDMFEALVRRLDEEESAK